MVSRLLSLIPFMVLGTIGIARPVDPIALTASVAPYHLAPGDKVRVTVFNETALSSEYSLTPAGNVAFPLIGLVHAEGKSVEDLQDAITAKLAAGYVNDPRVSAEVITFRPYYILGEVNRPGGFPFTVGLTLDQAVAVAGGYTYRANHRRAYLRRVIEPKEMVVDLRSGPIRIAPGDTIRIGERYF